MPADGRWDLTWSLTLRRLMSYIYIYIYMEHPFLMFLDHTQRRNTVGRTPLDEWSARRRDLYLATHDTHNRQTSMPPVGFEPTTSAGERPKTYTLDRAATGTGLVIYTAIANLHLLVLCNTSKWKFAIAVYITRCCKYSQVLLVMGENIAQNM